jgi:hypothetical protein
MVLLKNFFGIFNKQKYQKVLNQENFYLKHK